MLAESSAVDRETNRVSLFNVIEQLQLLDPPERAEDSDLFRAVPLRFVVVTLFGRTTAGEGENKQARIAVALPDGNVVESEPIIDVDLETGPRYRSLMNLSGLPIGGQGEYRFQIQQLDENGDWHWMFEVPLQVNFLDQ